jgi:hypothetical protein
VTWFQTGLTSVRSNHGYLKRQLNPVRLHFRDERHHFQRGREMGKRRFLDGNALTYLLDFCFKLKAFR